MNPSRSRRCNRGQKPHSATLAMGKGKARRVGRAGSQKTCLRSDKVPGRRKTGIGGLKIQDVFAWGLFGVTKFNKGAIPQPVFRLGDFYFEPGFSQNICGRWTDAVF
ncbi:hypothetical protein X474_20470 [Dethiosulfatarculus sandiegensis]|uniref:Uncharacterized protein n=1 Tax=Dethiosulfatarculus sandiegensis TaxID=1429043 RepID=A0A0D2J9C4_9BACT|nr:hypothetical protein X474_20470 [Dethiosulfatarculus sandiegensis]